VLLGTYWGTWGTTWEQRKNKKKSIPSPLCPRPQIKKLNLSLMHVKPFQIFLDTEVLGF
jgi:hypothetical protein